MDHREIRCKDEIWTELIQDDMMSSGGVWH